ncbi:quinoprotein glucose dehydrogenase [Pricia antarctica]|uniref:Quinoprotein glucose dehydrogenase n=1 Tax=Pricia antarctica TaxID=641691 RepID=A0A1G7IZV0_9FLAO|nr:PQQ-binding-like beta-propeller repeat protein [Pricia antarctica]SDF18181.1 quinoprotein glucose dehydrogenase [Pricia antarctica]
MSEVRKDKMSRIDAKIICFPKLLVLAISILTGCNDFPDANQNVDWPVYGGNKAGNRYSKLEQIKTDNVNRLKVAWTYDASDTLELDERPKEIQCQPIMIDSILYGTTPNIQVFALNAKSGKELWRYNPEEDNQGYRGQNRGVCFWQNGEDKRILFVAGNRLIEINAMTGKPVEEFGNNGKVDFYLGLENDMFDVRNHVVTATSPGIVYKDIFITGNRVSESGDALSGSIRGFDVHTGKLLWVFHTIPLPGEDGYETWPEDAYKKFGGANSWSGIVLDEKRGTVYLGTGSPSVDFYGGDRKGANLFANCILALDATSGKLKWHYQTVHHDLWDLDIPNPPNLVTVEHKGRMVDAVAQTTKDGLVYLLDRETGVSLFPVEERPVRTDGLPGEHPYPTQKYPVKPLPLVTRQVITEADLPDSTYFPEAHKDMKERFLKTRHGSKFIPPSEQGSWYIGVSGGAEWGGSAADPDGILYQNVSEEPWEMKMVNVAEKLKKSTSYGNSLYIAHCAACHGEDLKGDGAMFPSLADTDERFSNEYIRDILKNGRGRMPAFPNISEKDRNAIIKFISGQKENYNATDDEHSNTEVIAAKGEDFPYMPPYNRGGGGKVRDSNGYPGIRPPWGTLNAVDLNTGEYLWRVPLGEYKELTEQGVPITGTPNAGGPLVTAGGLVFISGTQDEKIRAFDRKTGKVVWEYQLSAGAFATPITYMLDGKQYVVIAAGGVRYGLKPGGNYIAFSLP